MRLVGFIIRIYDVVQPPERQISSFNYFCRSKDNTIFIYEEKRLKWHHKL